MDHTFDDERTRDVAHRIHLLSRDLNLIESLRAPTLRDYLEAPVIENWKIGARYEPALIGMVTGHPARDNGPAVTSGLYYLDEKIGVARTLSRWYRLGRRAGGG